MIIYGIENLVNDKLYVGQTRNELNKRVNEHKCLLRNNGHSNLYLQNSWNKYGENKFRFFILEDGFTCLEDLSEAEKFWIDVLSLTDSDQGYNLTYGGENNYTLPKEVKDKISNNHSKYWLGVTGKDHPSFNIKRSKEFKEKLRRANLGKVLSTNTRKKISNSLKNNINVKISREKQCKQVLQFDLDGNLIKEWRSISDISNKLNISRSCISRVCKGERNTSKGFKWRFKN